ncbi:helix-turn-helix transcriptional regulator [Limnoglobus roseus]|uniref:DNA-binding response regulator n=1 Tax=Limnoglobus roseus TaxID=2598579 RepID=A0A5C1AEA4_9BACT|nr:response regulator transcription factor [Limnoglobus roseus]QEL17571.1 DNA-binding response regulator [Limnoglobus roseus]
MTELPSPATPVVPRTPPAGVARRVSEGAHGILNELGIISGTVEILGMSHAAGSSADQAAEKILQACHRAADECRRLSEDVDAMALPPPVAGGVQPSASPHFLPLETLSERETVVLRNLALGYSNKQIAQQMGLSVKTLETYKTRALEKLGIRTRVEIVRYAARRGWFNGL